MTSSFFLSHMYETSIKHATVTRARRLKKNNVDTYPNQQRTLNMLPSELRCRNFVNKHRLSIQVGAKRAKTCMQCVHIPTEPPFCIPPLVVGMARSRQAYELGLCSSLCQGRIGAPNYRDGCLVGESRFIGGG